MCDQTCLHTQPSVPAGEGPTALAKTHCCHLAAQELALNRSESPDPVSATHSVTQSVCQVRTAQRSSNLGHLQCTATETLCCLRPHVTYQSVSPKTCCHPQPCHCGLCSPFPGGVCAPLSTPQGFRESGPQSSSQRQGPKYTWSRGDQNTEAPHKARWAEESQKQTDSQRQGCREA